MIPLPPIKHPYTEGCKALGHRASKTGLACDTCRGQANQDTKRAAGKIPPIKHPYTSECRTADHKPGKGGRFCQTCRSKGLWAGWHKRHQENGTITPAPSSGNGHQSDTSAALSAWADELQDAFIFQSHYVPESTDPFRPGYVQSLLSRRPRT